MVEVVGRLQFRVLGGKLPGSLDIRVHLEVEAAFQLGALAGQLLRVEGYVLVTGRPGRDADKVGQPGGAAQRTATWAYAADASGLLARSDLLHLDSHLESLGKHLDELAEVDTLVGYVVEDGLVAVTLVFHIADFHVELEVGGDFAGAYHGVVLAGAGLLVTLEVRSLRLAEHTAGLGVGLHSSLAHLQAHKRAG